MPWPMVWPKLSRARVPEVSLFVLLDDAGLDGDVAGDEIGGDVAVAGVEGGEFVEHRGVADGGVLDDLGEALAEFAVGQGARGFPDRPARGAAGGRRRRGSCPRGC